MSSRSRVVAWVALAAMACGAKVDGPGSASHGDGANGGNGAASGGNPGSGGASAATGGTTGEPTCARSCRVAMGTPLDVARGCFDDAKQVAIGCDCTLPNPDGFTGQACGRRISDGTEWLAPSTVFDDLSVWGPCTADPGAYHSCLFAHCAVPPASLCDLAATCSTLGCGSVEFDGDGCARPSCVTDADCPEEERCVRIPCGTSASCSPVTEGCLCTTLLFCAPRRVCNSTKVYGSRGDWLEFYMFVGRGPCRDGDCLDRYALTADGSATVTKAQSATPATLLPELLQELTLLIDGPEVRPALRDGADCGPGSTDIEVRMQLRTTTENLHREVTACALNPDSALHRIYEILKGL